MSMLKKATNKIAYGKVGLYGNAGSGKTFTAAKLAIGLHKFAKCKKPVGMFDTEPAASFIAPLFKEAGIDFYVYDESRALKDLLAFMDEAEKDCSIVIVDSITHVWRDVQESYMQKIGRSRLEFQDWRPIKNAWGEFTDRFLSSKVHVILCGRAGNTYEYQENDRTGKKELITTGTKMSTEKELGYEPSLLIEMVSEKEGDKLVNTAYVLKDRADKLNGQAFPFPSFDSFAPHFKFLNIGGEHFGSMEQRDSKDMFQPDGADNWSHEQRQRTIWCEEVQGIISKHYPGMSAEEKKKKADLVEQIFQTRSWTQVENLPSEKIKAGYMVLKAILEAPQAAEPAPAPSPAGENDIPDSDTKAKAKAAKKPRATDKAAADEELFE